MATIKLSELTIPHTAAVNLLLNVSLPLDEYKQLAEQVIKGGRADRLLIVAITGNHLEHTKILFELGMSLVDTTGKTVLFYGQCDILSPECRVSEELAIEIAKHIIGTSGKTLKILKRAMGGMHARFRMFQCIQDPAILAGLYIHLGVVPSNIHIEHRLETLLLCGRAGLFNSTREREIRDLIVLQDKAAEAFKRDLTDSISVTRELTAVRVELEDCKRDNETLKRFLSEAAEEIKGIKQQHADTQAKTALKFKEIQDLIKSE